MPEGCSILMSPVLFHRGDIRNFDKVKTLKVCSSVHGIKFLLKFYSKKSNHHLSVST
jgi:hypothetical protein